jgi:hypothetical protein
LKHGSINIFKKHLQVLEYIKTYYLSFITEKLKSFCFTLIDRNHPHSCFTAQKNQVHRLDRFPIAVEVLEVVMTTFIESSLKYSKDRMLKYIVMIITYQKLKYNFHYINRPLHF